MPVCTAESMSDSGQRGLTGRQDQKQIKIKSTSRSKAAIGGAARITGRSCRRLRRRLSIRSLRQLLQRIAHAVDYVIANSFAKATCRFARRINIGFRPAWFDGAPRSISKAAIGGAALITRRSCRRLRRQLPIRSLRQLLQKTPHAVDYVIANSFANATCRFARRINIGFRPAWFDGAPRSRSKAAIGGAAWITGRSCRRLRRRLSIRSLRQLLQRIAHAADPVGATGVALHLAREGNGTNNEYREARTPDRSAFRPPRALLILILGAPLNHAGRTLSLNRGMPLIKKRGRTPG